MAKLKPSEKKMLYALAGVAVFAAFILFKPDGGAGAIQEVAMGAVDSVEETMAERDEMIQRLAGSDSGQSSGGGGGGARIASSVNTLEHHNTPNNCWVVLGDIMYDITTLLPEYPGGGVRIEKYCGTTGFEENFNFEQVMTSEEFIELAVEIGPYTG